MEGCSCRAINSSPDWQLLVEEEEGGGGRGRQGQGRDEVGAEGRGGTREG
jgi:hypothetical protein